MYVVKYKGNVVLGIIPWNNQYIMDVMRSRYRQTIEIPYVEPQPEEFPLQVTDDIIIYPAEEDRASEINPLIEYYYGPTWELVDDKKIIAHYEVRPLELNDAKNNYRGKAAQIRYDKEIKGTVVLINGVEYSVETDRSSKSKYTEKLVAMSDNEVVNWKFNQGWGQLTKSQMQTVVAAINAYVQSAFDEEYQLNIVIDQATSAEDLLAIEALNKQENNLLGSE